MSNIEFSQHKIYLQPAELILAEEPTTVTTVLGSCVSVTLFCPRLQFGAICHAVLPSGKDANPSKYSDQSVKYMFDFFRARGIHPHELEAKLFGGADMFTHTSSKGSAQTIGAQNICFANEALRKVGLEPQVLDVGGKHGRKLIFHSHTGEVLRKWVNRKLLQY